MFPQLWRIFTAFLITKPKFAILLDPYFLYQYGSSIERESSRFAQPGDFFVYTLFVGSVIAVSTHLQLSRTPYHRNKHAHRTDTTVCDATTTVKHHLIHLPAQPTNLAEAVPKIEEDHPCTSCSSVIRKIQKGLVWCVGMVGLSLEKALRMLSISLGGVGSLHTFTTCSQLLRLMSMHGGMDLC